MKIEILGTDNCEKCNELFSRTKEAVGKNSDFIKIEQIKDPLAIIKRGVTSLPALLIDGKVKSSGKLLSIDEIKNFIDN